MAIASIAPSELRYRVMLLGYLGPSLPGQRGEILHQVILSHAGRVNHVPEIIFRIGQDKGGMIGPAFRGRNLGCQLRGIDGRFAAGEADDALGSLRSAAAMLAICIGHTSVSFDHLIEQGL